MLQWSYQKWKTKSHTQLSMQWKILLIWHSGKGKNMGKDNIRCYSMLGLGEDLTTNAWENYWGWRKLSTSWYDGSYTNVSICQTYCNCTLKRVNFTVWNYILVNLALKSEEKYIPLQWWKTRFCFRILGSVC